MGLAEYRRKRDFERTNEPRGKPQRRGKRPLFVVQQHAASRLHWDFRLEHRGVLLSWAVPKGPSLDPSAKRLAVHVEDHPREYASFEGAIPAGEYGAGEVILWDRGTWEPIGDPDAGLGRGKLEFRLDGEKLQGAWVLLAMRGEGSEGGKNWLLVKQRDEFARAEREYDVVRERAESVESGRVLGERKGGQATTRRSAREPAPRNSRRGTKQPRAERSSKPQSEGLASAPRAPLPRFVAPQLATLVDAAPAGAEWLHEIKFDGYRMLARIEGGRVRWLSRNGLDWTRRFAQLSPELARLRCDTALCDGEVAALRPDGTTSFQDLQRALGNEGSAELVYFVFDLLHLDGRDLRGLPLVQRKELLQGLFRGRSGRVRYSEHVDGRGESFYAAACRNSLEGIVSKLREAPYRSGRTRDWLKVKCTHEQEAIVVGYTEPRGSRAGLGALALGVRERGKLRYAGRVGTGFDARTLRRLRGRLEDLQARRSPLDVSLPAAEARGVHWVRPELVAEIAFTGWTADGRMRHPSFRGLREDKRASEVVRERPARSRTARASAERRVTAKAAARAGGAAAEGSAIVAGVTITHPERVLYAAHALTKLDLARYYERVAAFALPHVAGRPLSIVRCPSGSGGACFYQKHPSGRVPDGVESVSIAESSGKARYLMVDSAAGLVGLVQMGALELHPWGSRAARLERPERITLDLDPAPGVPWKRVVDAALAVRKLLEELELGAFLKTTGGKGLHVVVPLAGRDEWDAVKDFSHAVASALARSEPRLYVDVASKSRRAGRIFVDYLRNARGATAVAAYSTRANPRATVSTPIHWKELESGARADGFTVPDVEARLARGFRDPWARFESARGSLGAAKRRALGS